jgi:molybdate transport system ATP-binding protein
LPFLSRLNQELNIPILYVTHSDQEVAQLADYLVVLENGKVQAAGELSQTLSRLDLSLSQEKTASTVWNANVIEHEKEFYLTRVAFESGTLYLPAIEAKIGTSLRVQIYARDVSIVLEVPRATSILNVLPAKIVDIADGERGQSIVRLEVGKQPLLAHITRKSAVVLNLKIGKQVFVQIKGMSILS